MLRVSFISSFILMSILGLAQVSTPQFMFTGQILDKDSIPVEQAYLVNYRTLRAYATNSQGRFRIPVQTGDSLKIVHVTYLSKIIKPTEHACTIMVDDEINMIETVTVKSVDLELQYFNRNWEIIKKQMAQEFHYNYSHNFVRNPYAPIKGPSGIIEFNLFEVIDRIKRSRNK